MKVRRMILALLFSLWPLEARGAEVDLCFNLLEDLREARLNYLSWARRAKRDQEHVPADPEMKNLRTLARLSLIVFQARRSEELSAYEWQQLEIEISDYLLLLSLKNPAFLLQRLHQLDRWILVRLKRLRRNDGAKRRAYVEEEIKRPRSRIDRNENFEKAHTAFQKLQPHHQNALMLEWGLEFFEVIPSGELAFMTYEPLTLAARRIFFHHVSIQRIRQITDRAKFELHHLLRAHDVNREIDQYRDLLDEPLILPLDFLEFWFRQRFLSKDFRTWILWMKFEASEDFVGSKRPQFILFQRFGVRFSETRPKRLSRDYRKERSISQIAESLAHQSPEEVETSLQRLLSWLYWHDEP